MNSRSTLSRTACFFLFISFLVFGFEAFADKICTDDVVKVKRKKVRVTKALRLQTGDCPQGFTELVDTESFTGPQGPAGSDGSDGADGTNGTNGTDGVSGHEVVDETSNSFTLTNNSLGVQSSDCPGAKVVVGGGCFTNSPVPLLISTAPETTAGTSWQCIYRNISGSSINNLEITARAVCVTAN